MSALCIVRPRLQKSKGFRGRSSWSEFLFVRRAATLRRPRVRSPSANSSEEDTLLPFGSVEEVSACSRRREPAVRVRYPDLNPSLPVQEERSQNAEPPSSVALRCMDASSVEN